MKRKRVVSQRDPPANGAARTRRTQPNVIKVENSRGGFTIVANKRAKVGDSSVIGGVRYTIRDRGQLLDLIYQEKWDDVARTCTSRITDMSRLFRYPEFNSFNGDISHWDTSNVRTMREMFRRSRFNGKIDTWDVSKVTDISEMFCQATFNKPLNRWNVSNVKMMERTFDSATRFNKPLNMWDVKSVTSIEGMFYEAGRFQQSVEAWGDRFKHLKNADSAFHNVGWRLPWGKNHFKTPSWWYRFQKIRQKSKRPTKSRAMLIEEWTTGLYKDIQDSRGMKKGTLEFLDSSVRTNRAIAQYMRDSGLKAPMIPTHIKPLPQYSTKKLDGQYIFRGVHGPQASSLVSKGSVVSKGYLPFTRSSKIAVGFAESGIMQGATPAIVLCLKVSTIPHGTPWIWFDDRRSCQRGRGSVRSAAPVEKEVLLPPGKLKLEEPAPHFLKGSMTVPWVTVSYTPDQKSRSLDGKRIIRRIAPAKRDVHNTPNKYDREVSALFRKLVLN